MEAFPLLFCGGYTQRSFALHPLVLIQYKVPAMRLNFVLTSICLAALSPSMFAQQYYGYHGDSISSLTRSGLDNQGGEIHIGFLSQFNRGLGDNGNGCGIRQLSIFLRDQEAATQETFGFVVRTGNDKVGPYPAASALLHHFPGYQLPLGTGAIARMVTLTFSKRLMLPNCRNFFSIGVEFAPAPNWPSDGLCLFGENNAAQKANAHAVRPNWRIKQGVTNRSPYSDWTYAGSFGIGIDGPAMRMGEYGGHNGVRGLNGHAPAVGTSLQAMIHYGAGWDAGLSMLYVGLGRQPGVPLLAGSGQFYLTSPTLYLTGATIGTGCCGHTEHSLAPSVPASWTGLGKFHFQSVGIANGKATLSNVVTIKL